MNRELLMGGIKLLLLILLALPLQAKGETGQAYNWIAQLGQIQFSQGGAASIPGYVLGSMRGGNISPIMMFVLVNSMMNQCIKSTYQFYPRRRDPFPLAAAKFQFGLCKINKCFQQSMLLLLLPQLSGRSQFGGQSGQQGSQQMGLLLAQGFQKGDACGGNGSSDKGISQSLVNAFGGQQQQQPR